MIYDGIYNVIVHFTTTPETQSDAIVEIGAYVDEFLSRQQGFLQSWLSSATDGENIVHFALWQSEADFRAAGEQARRHPALPGLMRYEPRARHHTIARVFGGG
jgi:heme-degrading monooxygenase HmoA